ncbi:MAG TPA: DUF4249 domain-containing protein [Mucilaginibacter sp.]|jgi:hypothetical protein|nr:DUF4249 domain-containing protein [Mucilaginibacter sp.]
MNRKGCIYLILISGVVTASCRKPYEPPVVAVNNNYLVVEGVINAGSDSTFIKLSRTVKISDKVAIKPESGAVLTIEGDQNTSYPLTETGNGNYASPGLNLGNTHKYRLRIKTVNNEQYLSDYVEVLNSPPIDSVNYDVKGTLTTPGLNVYVNTHDPNNKVLYYRWDYQETWVIQSYYSSYFKSNGDTVLGRDLINDNITDCWQSDTSSTILLGSTAKLSQDILSNYTIISIPSTSEKLGNKYSILVRQYALTSDAYNFYVNLKKNTEQLGSIFDAQPSELTGNIHCVTNPSEPVIGYISVGATSSQRIFATNRQLPTWRTDKPFYAGCHLAFEWPTFPCCYYNFGGENQVDEYINYNKGGHSNPLIPIDALSVPGHPPLGYTASTRNCVDCTVRGTNKRPAFWR